MSGREGEWESGREGIRLKLVLIYSLSGGRNTFDVTAQGMKIKPIKAPFVGLPQVNARAHLSNPEVLNSKMQSY